MPEEREAAMNRIICSSSCAEHSETIMHIADTILKIL